MVLHESAEHASPSLISTKLGNATVVFATSSSVKPKAHPLVPEQNVRKLTATSLRNNMIGDIKAASI